MKEKILGEFEVNVNVDWGKPLSIWEGEEYVKRQSLDYREGFFARLLVSESRMFIITEFTDDFKMGILTPVISGVEKKQRSLYLELALNKMDKYYFGMMKNTILFKPHGVLGKIIIEFKNLSGELKKTIPETLEKARALKIRTPNSGILVSDRPIKEIFEERMRIINAEKREPKYQIAPEIESENETISVPLATSEFKPNTETVLPEASPISESSESKPAVQEEGPSPSTNEIQVTEPSVAIEEIKTAHSMSKEVEIEEAKKLEKTWKSLVPKETICPYCKKRVLTIDRTCPDCGAINL